MTADELYERLREAKRNPEPDYGGNVLPAGRIFSNLSQTEELSAFREALERMLGSQDHELRAWAVNVCLGFIYFRDAIAWPRVK